MAKTPDLKTIDNLDFNSLSPAEQKAVIWMRELKPFQKIEIKFAENRPGKIAVTRNETLREDFPT